MDRLGYLQLAFLFILIALSGFFSSAETALTTVSRITLRSMADDGDVRAKRVLAVLADHSRMLSTILICNNVVNISASALLTAFVIRVFGADLVTISTAVLTVAILLFGEITPKNISMIRALERSLRIAPVIGFLMKALTPVIALINVLSGAVLRLLRVDPGARRGITERELRTYVEESRQQGVIENDEKKIIYNVFDLGDSVAKDIMVPRIDMTCVPADAGYRDIMAAFRRDMFTRMPVYDSDPDHIVGLINVKDLILVRDPADFSMERIMRRPFYTYEYKKTSDLLRELQQNAQSVAFVLNEYGSVVGMITLEDIVEEIVGEIRDEYDAQEKELIRRYDDRTYLVEGSLKLDDVNDAVGSSFDSEDYDSIGGLIIEQLERLPADGETISLPDGTTLQAKGIRQNRIVKVLIRFPEKPAGAEGGSADASSPRPEGHNTAE